MNLINKYKSIKNHKLVRNIMILFKGNMLVSIIALINTALLVNAIGLEKNGIIFMAISYVMLFNTVFNFQSYNAIIKFVPRYLGIDNNKAVNYLKQGLFLDIITAILSIIVALSLLNPISNIMEWDYITKKCTYIYIFIILFRTTGTMSALLRVFDKFKESVFVNLSESITRFILLSIGVVFKFNIYYFVIVDILGAAVSLIFMCYFTLRTIKNEKLDFIQGKWRLDKKFFKFNLYSNLEVALDMPVKHIAPFIINSMLGFSEIAVYKIIEKIGTIISKITIPINQAIYPDLSKKIAKKDIYGALKIHQKAKKIIGVFGCIIILAAMITSSIWIEILIPNTKENIIALVLYLIYIIVTNMFMALHPIFNFLGYIKKNIPIIAISNSIYLIILPMFATNFGIIGVIIAKLLQAIIVILAKEITLKNKGYKEINI